LTTITHIDSGEIETSEVQIILSKVTAQEFGSFITYMRRYTITAMLGIVTDIDDDGNAASKPQNNQTLSKPVKQERPPASEVIMDGAEWQKLVHELKESITLGDLQATFKKVQSLAGSMSKAQLDALIKEKDKTKTAILTETGGLQ
jgi:hypothetical protein